MRRCDAGFHVDRGRASPKGSSPRICAPSAERVRGPPGKCASRKPHRAPGRHREANGRAAGARRRGTWVDPQVPRGALGPPSGFISYHASGGACLTHSVRNSPRSADRRCWRSTCSDFAFKLAMAVRLPRPSRTRSRNPEIGSKSGELPPSTWDVCFTEPGPRSPDQRRLRVSVVPARPRSTH